MFTEKKVSIILDFSTSCLHSLPHLFLHSLHEAGKAGVGFCGWVRSSRKQVVVEGTGKRQQVRSSAPRIPSKSAFVSHGSLSVHCRDVFQHTDFFFFPLNCQDRPVILSNGQLKSFLLEESQLFPHCLHSQKHTGQKFRDALFKMASWFCYGNCWFLNTEEI